MHGEALRAAVTDRVDLGQVALLTEERIVRRCRAVVVEPQHLAVKRREVLRGAAERAAGGHEEPAVGREGDARAERRRGLAPDQGLETADTAVLELAAHQGQPGEALVGAAGVAFGPRRGIVVGEVDQVVAGEIRMRGDVLQADAEERIGRAGHAGDRFGIEHRRRPGHPVHHPQVEAAFGQQQVAARQEGDGERPLQLADQRDRLDPVLFGGVEHVGRLVEHHRLDADLGLLRGGGEGKRQRRRQGQRRAHRYSAASFSAGSRCQTGGSSLSRSRSLSSYMKSRVIGIAARSFT